MVLLSTASGRAWVAQFTGTERKTAESLLEAILVTATDTIKSDIEAAVLDILRETESKFYIAPVISDEDVDKVLRAKTPNPGPPQMFENYEPHEIIGYDGGSENYLALVARDIRRALPKRRYRPNTVRERLAAAEQSGNSIDFLFIVDNSLSGSQVSWFMKSFWSSKLIIEFLARPKSSIRVHLICWGATRQVIDVLGSFEDKYRINTVVVYNVPTVDSSFEAGPTRTAITNFIQKYAKKIDSGPSTDLGFGNVGALFLPLGASAPNNLPELLIRRPSAGEKYKSLFPSRVIPEDIKALSRTPRQLPLQHSSKYQAALEKKSIKSLHAITANGTSKVWATMVLMALEWSETDIRTQLGLTYVESKALLASLTTAGWATNNFVLTESGHALLRNYADRQNRAMFMRGTRYPGRRFDQDVSGYYPRSVRGVR